MSIFDSDKINNPITPRYVTKKGFIWTSGTCPPEELVGLPFGRKLVKYDYMADAIVSYYPKSQQLHINGPHYSWAKYIKVNDEYEFDAAYLYLIQLYKNHEHI